MKKDLHPKYFDKTQAKCACGSVYVVGSTEENLQLEICANCHPFYTGKGKLVDTAGKAEKFKARLAKAGAAKPKVKKVRKKK